MPHPLKGQTRILAYAGKEGCAGAREQNQRHSKLHLGDPDFHCPFVQNSKPSFLTNLFIVAGRNPSNAPRNETMVETGTFVGTLQGNRITPGFLSWCEMDLCFLRAWSGKLACHSFYIGSSIFLVADMFRWDAIISSQSVTSRAMNPEKNSNLLLVHFRKGKHSSAHFPRSRKPSGSHSWATNFHEPSLEEFLKAIAQTSPTCLRRLPKPFCQRRFPLSLSLSNINSNHPAQSKTPTRQIKAV